MSVVAAQRAVPAILRPLVSLALLLAMVAAFTSSSRASTIGPTNDWVPLSEGVKQGMLSAAFADRILHAAVDAQCVGHTYKVEGKDYYDADSENGWFLGSNTQWFYSNAHFVADDYGNARQPVDQCYVQLFADIARDGLGNATKYLIDPSSPHSELGGLSGVLVHAHAVGPDFATDRARIALMKQVVGARGLSFDTTVASTLAVGSEVFMVSRPPNGFHTAPETLIQRCHVMRHFSPSAGRPGLLATDCDNQKGDSGALYFVPDPANPGALLPVAMTEGNFESGENQPWSMDNSDVAIALDDNFFNFDQGFRLRDLLGSQ